MENFRGAGCGNRIANKGNMARNSGWFPCFVLRGKRQSLNDGVFMFVGDIMLKDMKSYANLKPGQKGTRRLMEKYGDSLLCVRYRYDEKRGLGLKTAEIIVEAKPGTPSFRYRDTDICGIIFGVRRIYIQIKRPSKAS
jgi:hypothetical protein